MLIAGFCLFLTPKTERPDMVARFLAGWIRGIGYMLNPEHRAKSEEYLAEFNENTFPGYVATAGSIENDFTLRPFFDLQGQLDIFDRSNGKSEVDNWYEAVSGFLIENNVIDQNPTVDSYITDKYLKMVETNETLREYTLRSTAGYVGPEDMEEDDKSSSPSRSTMLSLLTMMIWLASLVF